MPKRKVIRTDDPGVEFRYASWLKMVIDLVQPKNLFLLIGRGGAKDFTLSVFLAWYC